MDGSCLVVSVCLGRYYPPTPLGFFVQHWYLFGLPFRYPSLRSSTVAIPLGLGSVWWDVPLLLWGFGLPLQGSRSRLVSLNVIGGCHRASKYHATLCPGSVCMAYKLQSSPQTAPRDDAEKSPVSHTVLTRSKQYLHNKKRRPNREHWYGAS